MTQDEQRLIERSVFVARLGALGMSLALAGCGDFEAETLAVSAEQQSNPPAYAFTLIPHPDDMVVRRLPPLRCSDEDTGTMTYELIVTQHMADESKNGGAFATPRVVVQTEHGMSGYGTITINDFIVVDHNGGSLGSSEPEDVATDPGTFPLTFRRTAERQLSPLVANTFIDVDVVGIGSIEDGRVPCKSPAQSGLGTWDVTSVTLYPY